MRFWPAVNGSAFTDQGEKVDPWKSRKPSKLGGAGRTAGFRAQVMALTPTSSVQVPEIEMLFVPVMNWEPGAGKEKEIAGGTSSSMQSKKASIVRPTESVARTRIVLAEFFFNVIPLMVQEPSVTEVDPDAEFVRLSQVMQFPAARARLSAALPDRLTEATLV